MRALVKICQRWGGKESRGGFIFRDQNPERQMKDSSQSKEKRVVEGEEERLLV